MIGWRPHLLTGLALLLLAVVVLDVASAVKQPSPCARGAALFNSQLIDEAHQEYESVLKNNPKSSCAREGLANTTFAECRRASAIAATDPSDARSELLAIAGDPIESTAATGQMAAANQCVVSELVSLPAAKGS